MKKEEQIDWHSILQDILDDYLPLMSGKTVTKTSREKTHYYKVDYYCEVEGRSKQKKSTEIRPFEHLKKKNIIEYKSWREVLNEGMFRQYIGRVLLIENPKREESYRGEMTLTIFTTHTPKALLAYKEYGFKKIHEWKYESRFFKDLEIYILIQREMKDIQGGEALALLQVLEGEEKRQKILWDALYQQELPNIKIMEKIMHKINKEVGMTLAEHYENIGIEKGKKLAEVDKTTLAEHYKQEGKLEGKLEMLLEAIEIKFGKMPKTLQKQLEEISDEKKLEQLFKMLFTTNSLTELKQQLKK